MKDVAIPIENIKISGRIGKWFVIDVNAIYFQNIGSKCSYYLALLEHQTYGDLAGHILAFFM